MLKPLLLLLISFSTVAFFNPFKGIAEGVTSVVLLHKIRNMMPYKVIPKLNDIIAREKREEWLLEKILTKMECKDE